MLTAVTITALPGADPILNRLNANHPLAPAEAGAVLQAQGSHVRHRAGAEILAEGRADGEPQFVLRGWAACTRTFGDGRRQILRLVTPGDVVGLQAGRGPPGWSVMAVTDVVTVPAGPVVEAATKDAGQGLARALALAVRQEEAQFLDQIVRLGGMSAGERVANLMLELRDRLQAVGLGDGRRFPCPLTQEMLADTLGLSAVHVNRVLKDLRETGLLVLRGGTAVVEDSVALARLGLRAAHDVAPAATGSGVR